LGLVLVCGSIRCTMGTDFLSYFVPTYVIFLPDVLSAQLQCECLTWLHMPLPSVCTGAQWVTEQSTPGPAVGIGVVLILVVLLATFVYHVSPLYQVFSRLSRKTLTAQKPFASLDGKSSNEFGSSIRYAAHGGKPLFVVGVCNLRPRSLL
jgi:Na+-transporting methylmalonyl-CoA/oxaloacetate decarboxylase gamma subunit